MKKMTAILLSMFGLGVLVLGATPSVQAATECNASNKDLPVCQARNGSKATTEDAANAASLGDQLKIVVNILLFILGAIAVIMIVVGGIRYTTSNGEASAITGAKNTILYSVVGLVVAILAYAIVNFVLSAF